MFLLSGHAKHLIFRILVVAASGIVAGYCFRGSLIFVPTTVSFQFTYSTITVALFYGFSKSLSFRDALVAVLVWYVLSTLLDVKNGSTMVMYLVYVAGISTAVHIYLRIISRPLFRGVLQRIASFSLLLAALNAAIIVVLKVLWAIIWNLTFQRTFQLLLDNFQLGALIGLGLGAGIQLAEYVLSLHSFQEFIEGAKNP